MIKAPWGGAEGRLAPTGRAAIDPEKCMSVHNEDIARVFDEIADLLEIRGENAFRIRAYRNASREVRGLPKELAQMVAAGADLTELPGIGEALAG